MSPSCRVAIVYGSFASETSAEDAEIIQEYAMHRKLDLLMRVADGDEFDFDSLASCSHLVLATSSWRSARLPRFLHSPRRPYTTNCPRRA